MQYAQNIKDLNELANSVYMTSHVGRVNSFPEFITVMPLVKCNYNCVMCAESERDSDKELSELALSRLEEVLPFARTLFITGGEPLMYPHLERLLRAGSQAGCELWMVSNGSLLTEKKREMLLDAGLSQVKISLDAATPKTYQKIRGGNFLKVLGNIAALSELKLRRGVHLPSIQLGFVAMRSNIAELGKLAVIAGNLGVDSIYVSTCTIHHEHMLEESLYFHQEYADHHMLKAIEMARAAGVRLERPPMFSELAAQAAQAVHQDRTSAMCREPWKTIFVRYDGAVNLCCGGGGNCGNLNDSSFFDVWNHPARVVARERVNSLDPLPACKACHTVKQTATNISSHIPSPELARLGEERYGKGAPLSEAV
ncbi:radical SAM protein [Fundidesulfovibrio terrae]|uniref:radical SAM protein n=1 Tax=Fundidesulfovibrio terrae TaxID=2922866 RepID=UPI001FAFF70C|nr:radical SAM protein [Fundidesulfovibrio terrae]